MVYESGPEAVITHVVIIISWEGAAWLLGENRNAFLVDGCTDITAPPHDLFLKWLPGQGNYRAR